MDDWYYMSAHEITAADLKAAAAEMDGLTADLWTEANVLELTLEDGTVIDFEPMRPQFKDAQDNQFLKARGIKTLFAVTADGGEETKVTAVLKSLSEKAGGFFCADTPDFKPEIGGTGVSPHGI